DGLHRGVTGKSSGGYGAITLGMRHQDLFSAVACHSGDAYFQYCYLRDFPKAADAINKAGGVEAFLKQFDEAPVKGPHIMVLNVIAMAAAYAPDDASEIALPFRLPSGELEPEVWSRWLELDPVNMAERYAGNLRALKLLYIDAGEKDEFALHLGARVLVERLKLLEIPHRYEEHSGGHFGINYRYKVSLKLLANALVPD
ncbi:MAG: esterase, partial [Candidatus Marinimicrobia bacterium]|nr:esterase [Candidatus Neomarinimicrobiota bacterium]